MNKKVKAILNPAIQPINVSLNKVEHNNEFGIDPISDRNDLPGPFTRIND